MSGLDPVGRKEVRDLIFAERDLGRTIFFSTHILGDVEAMCDRVTILRKGEVVVSGEIRSLLRGDVLHTDVMLAGVTEVLAEALAKEGFAVAQRPGVWVVTAVGEEGVKGALALAMRHDAQVIEVSPHKETLEDLFMKKAL
jgi:ABC-2 type transport system ATP-binding protein